MRSPLSRVTGPGPQIEKRYHGWSGPVAWSTPKISNATASPNWSTPS